MISRSSKKGEREGSPLRHNFPYQGDLVSEGLVLGESEELPLCRGESQTISQSKCESPFNLTNMNPPWIKHLGLSLPDV